MSDQSRPPFHPAMNPSDFERYYWYKSELQQICKQYGLPASGTKAELLNRVKGWLEGKEIRDDRQVYANRRKKANELAEITPETRLIPDGFKFNRKAREFFKRYYGVEKFSFTKEMAAALRDAERRGDMEMTVADLIRIYEESKAGKKRRPATAEEKTYQWNAFVRDFNADARTKGWSNRMQIAALLWRHVREGSGPKRYDPDLLDQFREEIEALKNGGKVSSDENG